MKKLALFLLMTATLSATAQDTLRVCSPRSNYLWTDWFDTTLGEVQIGLWGLAPEAPEGGIFFNTQDSLTIYGIAASASIEENVISDRSNEKRFNNGPLFNMKAIHEEADRLIKEYAVLCKSRKQHVGMLSGGNIQKVVVAREFSNDPVLIIADQPTRGIDVGATEFIRKKLVELSRSGIAVLLVSADLNEVMELSDSLIVMHNGQIAAYFDDTANLTDEIMGEYMLGLKHQSKEEVRRVCHD